jgi:hypothetical protein
VFKMGNIRKKKYDTGEIFRRFDNDVIGNFPELQFREQTVKDLCSIDQRQPLKFFIDYVKAQVMDDVSDEEE